MRQSSGSIVFRLTGAIALVLLSFWATLKILDYMSPTSREAIAPRTFYKLDKTAANWNVVDPSVTKVTVTADGIAVQSNAPALAYQWTSTPVAVRANADYALSYHVTAPNGKMGIGVLDFPKSTWIKTEDIGNEPGSMAFKASAERIQVILYSLTSPPTIATIHSIEITESTRP